MKKIQYIKPDQLGTIAMVNGEKDGPQCVLDQGLIRKRWVGIGWVSEGEADDTDIDRYPVVDRRDPVKEAAYDLLKAAQEALPWLETAIANEPEDYNNHKLKRTVSKLQRAIRKAEKNQP